MLHLRNIEELKSDWLELVDQLNTQFDNDLDLQGIIFLIGVQELGQGPREYAKHEKQDLMHIATCKLLSQFGYYTLEGLDEEGWPHWKLDQKMPPMTLGEQDYLLKQAVIDYFREQGLF
ncbi:MAG: hypothetical protein IPJ86_18305 [Bacteroidetes bacterium]|nr:hypothetical protein [Bacteroidota bacterium]MBK9318021.1 hypothetical protein [Bacteroidota bacterium]MBL0098377.1 hypothetical protein [Bacteroidota bacterium]